ncbi:glycosyltransferase [Nostoc sp. NMS4]|uniref:glycosyltransferase family 4 protein n=1 Tax=Nostoc sp. NMS4 TaxID=2815390 RepID=UPI0025D7E479|nr:glycosyltransferase [Nostoc sp. NMS4]MBN3926973.1 glycosyltransferase [Nostoc sp. NMS4]
MVKNKASTERIRVLILADDCNPDWHSLPALVYTFICTLAKYVDVVVVTQIRNKPNIEREEMGKAEVVYLDTEKIAAPIYKLATFLSGDFNKAMTLKVALSYPSTLAFEWAVWRRFRQDLQNGRFDIVHRLSPMSPTIPSPIAKWSPVPFVLGPILGGLPWPKHFKAEMNREGEWMNYFREIHRWLPFYQSTYAHAAAILAAYDHTISDVPDFAKPRTINFSEGGVDPIKFIMPVRHKKEQMTVLFVGRLVPFKMPEVLIRSFAASSILQQHKLIIVGDGPERLRLERLVEEEDLSGCVDLTGIISQDRVGELMRQSEIFAFPSIREQGGGVLTLAMMSGMACVVVDYGGPAARVKSGCGVKVPLGDLDHLVRHFTKELEQLVADPDRVISLGIAARRFTETYYSWEAKARKMLEIYNWVLGRQEEKPDFWNQPSASLSQSE